MVDGKDDRPDVLVTRRIPEEGLAILEEHFEIDIWEQEGPMPRDELLNRAPGKYAILSLLSDRIDEEVMRASSSLEVVANYAVGFDNIDVEKATGNGIAVLNTPGVLTDATADLAFALVLSSARRVAECDRYVRNGEFKTWGPRLMLGKDVHGSTLGVIGPGKIGKAVLKRGKGFDMQLLYHSRSRKHDVEEETGAEYVNLDELLNRSDFVSLNVPLNEETRHLIGERELSLMKKGAILVNTARGPVVDEKALYNALKEGRIWGAGLDVFEEEPKVYPPLMELDNVTMLPHVGSATESTRARMAVMAAEGILEWYRGGTPENLVNRALAEGR